KRRRDRAGRSCSDVAINGGQQGCPRTKGGEDMKGKGSLTTRVALTLVLSATLITALALGGQAAAQGGPETALAAEHFRVDGRVKEDHDGHAKISGYLYNDYGEAADQIRLRITELDASGHTVATYVEPISDTLPGFDRTYFYVKVPGHASSYQVAVDSFNFADTHE